MGDSGFGSMDFLQCCKFAEGDSRVLMLKVTAMARPSNHPVPSPPHHPVCHVSQMARDRLKRFAKESKLGVSPPPEEHDESRLCANLAAALGSAKGDKAAEAQRWDEEWLTVYALAEAVMTRTMAQAL